MINSLFHKMIIGSSFLWSNYLFADESQIPLEIKDISSTIKSSDHFSESYIIMILVLLLFLIGSFYLMKKLNRVIPNNKSTFKLKVLNNYPLGNKKYLSIIQVAGETLLIGVSDYSINLIKSLDFVDEDHLLATKEMINHNDHSSTNIQEFKKISENIANDHERMKKVEEHLSKNLEEEFSVTKLSSLVKDKIKTMKVIP